MTPDSLLAIGLDDDEARAYRTLLAMPDATPAQVGRQLDIEPARSAVLLEALASRGLVSRSRPGDDRYAASPPSLALRALLLERERAIRVAELEIADLETAYRSAPADLGAADVVEVVRGAAAVASRFEQLQATAEREILAFVKAPATVISGAENLAEQAALDRGVSYRVVMERAMLEQDPGLLGEISRSMRSGERLRITDAVPVKLLIADAELGLVSHESPDPSEPNALIVRRSRLLDALIALFEAEWARAREIWLEPGSTGEDVSQRVDELDRRILALLLGGLDDAAVAFQLRISMRTVQRRVRGLMDLAGVETRIQLGWQAARGGWLGGDDGATGSDRGTDPDGLRPTLP